MDLSNLIAKFYFKQDNAIANELLKWVCSNQELLVAFSEEELKQVVQLVSDDHLESVAIMEKLLSEMSWSERFEIMRYGIKKINAASTVKQREVALIISVLDLSVTLLPYLLAVL